MALVLDAPVATREGEQGLGVGLISREAGDGVSHFGLDLAGGLANAAALNPADLLDVRPGLTDAASITDASILGGIGQGPEYPPFIAPVLGFDGSVHDDGEGRSALLPLALLPADARRAAVQGRRNGRTRREGEQRGKRRGRYRLPERADCP